MRKEVLLEIIRYSGVGIMVCGTAIAFYRLKRNGSGDLDGWAIFAASSIPLLLSYIIVSLVTKKAGTKGPIDATLDEYPVLYALHIGMAMILFVLVVTYLIYWIAWRWG